MNKELEKQSERDPITGLYLPDVAFERIQSQLDSLSPGTTSGLIAFDLDHFRTINVARGRLFGDTILQRLGDFVRSLIGFDLTYSSDFGISARVGGDEFILFLPGAGMEKCISVIEKVRTRITDSYIDDDHHHRLTATIGVTMCGDRSAQTLLDNALAALYHAKKFHIGYLSVYEDLGGPLGFLDTHACSHLKIQEDWENESLFSFALRALEQVTDLKGTLHVLYSRIARLYHADEICVTEISPSSHYAQASYLWSARRAFLKPSGNIPIDDIMLRLESLMLPSSGPLFLNQEEIESFSPSLSRFLHCSGMQSMLLCPVYAQGVFRGVILYSSRSCRGWSPAARGELRDAACFQYNVIDRLSMENLNRANSAFISRMSHVLRAPLSDVIGLSEIAQSSTEDPVRVSMSLHRISQSAQDMLTFVDNVLEMSRLEHRGLGLAETSFSLRRLAQSLDSLMRGTAQEEQVFSVSASCQHDLVCGDEAGLRLVLTNLLANAFKFTSSTGFIRLSMEEVGARDEKRLYYFCVEDNGIGISQRNLSRILSRFHTSGGVVPDLHSGEGYGLALCDKLISLMGGRLNIESREYEGSRFSFTLPLLEGDPEKDEPVKSKGGLEGLRLLVAEDNEENIDAVRHYLQSHGAQVEIAHNGRDLVQKFSSSDPGFYDLILTDMRMPYMSGLEAAAIIRSLHRSDSDIPLITATSEVFDEHGRSSVQRYFNACLSKPTDIRRLIREIRRCLDLPDIPS